MSLGQDLDDNYIEISAVHTLALFVLIYLSRPVINHGFNCLLCDLLSNLQLSLLIRHIDLLREQNKLEFYLSNI